MERLIRAMPKVELHVHIEGTLEPEMMFALAERNRVSLPYRSVDEVRAAYAFANLQSFLDLYYRGAAVLCTEEDFFELAWAYLSRAHDENIRHVEVFFDPQTHTRRGIAFETVLNGLRRAFERGEHELGITSGLILCFLRDLGPQAAAETLALALAHREALLGVGLDSAEVGHPPEPFAAVFARARQAGLHAVAHAGEEGPPEYITGALIALGAERIDHGVRCLEDPALVEQLVRKRIPLTVCPFSNVRLRVFDRLEDHNLRRLLEAGLMATINSDDPAYFGGYLTDNWIATAKALALDPAEVEKLAHNAIEAAFAPRERKNVLEAELRHAVARHA